MEDKQSIIISRNLVSLITASHTYFGKVKEHCTVTGCVRQLGYYSWFPNWVTYKYTAPGEEL